MTKNELEDLKLQFRYRFAGALVDLEDEYVSFTEDLTVGATDEQEAFLQGQIDALLNDVFFPSFRRFRDEVFKGVMGLTLENELENK